MELAHRLVLCVCALSMSILAGCGPALSGQLYTFESLSSCPENLEDALAPVSTDINALSLSQLGCALQSIRNMKPPYVTESLLAAKLCSVLAESFPEGDAGTARRRSVAWEGVAWADYAMATGGMLKAESSYYYAMNLGLAVFDALTEGMRNIGKIHRHLVRAFEMDPDIDFGGPRRVLGYFLVRAPGWPVGVGDPDRGLKLLDEAVTLFPDYPINHLFMAKGLWEAEEKADEALEQIEQAIDLLETRDWGIRRTVWIRDIRKTAEDIVGAEKADEMISGLTRADTSSNY